MQTFLPYPDFDARVLDYRRLGKQRIEAKQIYLAITQGGGWRNHPAVRMWRGYVVALAHYGVVICREWITRGYRDNLSPFVNPPWLGATEFHASHRSNLLRKDPVWYGQFGWVESPELPYQWPEA